MENIFVEFLPPWVETGLQPAFYDKESGTVLQQTARMYAKVNQLVASVNNQNATIEDYISQFNELHDYVYDYFENLNVQAEIDTKLEQMMSNGELAELISSYVNSYVDPKIEAQNRNIAELQDTVHGLSSFAPIPVSSTSQMTDHNKVYVLTASGEWYYWNSTNSTWSVGGTYQATSLGLGSVDFDNLTNSLAQNIYGYSLDASALGLMQQTGTDVSYNVTTPMLIKAGTTVTVSSEFVENYHWTFRRINKTNELQMGSGTNNIFPYTTDTSYTFVNDEYVAFCWLPIDGNWATEDYTVNRRHRITNLDITSIRYFYPKRTTNTLIDLDVNQIINSYFGCTKQVSIFTFSSSRIGTSAIWKSDYDIIVDIKDKENYNFGVVAWDVSNNDWIQLSDTGWLSSQYIIPAGTSFTLLFRKTDNTSIVNVPEIKNMVEMHSYADLKYVRDYVDSYEQGVGTFNYEGEDLDFGFKHGFTATALFGTTLHGASTQGFDIYNGYLVQLYNGGILNILDMTDGHEVSVISDIGFQHGDVIQFTNDFYDENDLFPLAYVTSDASPGRMYVVRIDTLNTASIVKTYAFPIEDGYYCGYIADLQNNILYSIGYKRNSFRDGTNNGTIIASYDMSEETEVELDVYRPKLIERYEKPFIYTMQGMKMLNGIIYIVSSYVQSEQLTRIYTYDPLRKVFPAIFTDLPSTISAAETEDIAFIKGDNKYEMVVGTARKYVKFTFTK